MRSINEGKKKNMLCLCLPPTFLNTYLTSLLIQRCPYWQPSYVLFFLHSQAWLRVAGAIGSCRCQSNLVRREWTMGPNLAVCLNSLSLHECPHSKGLAWGHSEQRSQARQWRTLEEGVRTIWLYTIVQASRIIKNRHFNITITLMNEKRKSFIITFQWNVNLCKKDCKLTACNRSLAIIIKISY